jgi:hypothetical protein
MTPMRNGSIVQSLIWSEIVDVDRRIRFRTRLRPEIVFDDGVVVLSSRWVSAAESPTPRGSITSTDLMQLR